MQKWLASTSIPKVPTCPCPSGRYFKISKWISFTESWHFSNCCFCAGSQDQGDHKQAPQKRSSSDPCRTLGPLDISPTGFQTQMFCGGLIFPGQVLSTGVSNVGHKPPISQGVVLDPRDCSLLHLCWEWDFWWELVWLSILIWPFYSLLRSCSTSYQVFSSGNRVFSISNFSLCGCRLGVSTGGSEFSTFLCHLGPAPQLYFYLFLRLMTSECLESLFLLFALKSSFRLIFTVLYPNLEFDFTPCLVNFNTLVLIFYATTSLSLISWYCVFCHIAGV